MIFAVATLPNDVSIDKPRYVMLFHEVFSWGQSNHIKEQGWLLYLTLCAKIFNNQEIYFFLLTASVYVFSYLVFSRHFFEDKSFYFLIMAMGCLGFFSYSFNVIRAGFAIAFLLFGLSSSKKSWTAILMLCSVIFHHSMIIPVVAYYVTSMVKRRKVYYLIWMLCLLLAVANVDMGYLFEPFNLLDERVGDYISSVGQTIVGYKQGFRWDFLLYSAFPIAISSYHITKHKVEDEIYSRIFNMYLLTNSVWLLAIRVVFTDRIAYLSWFLIPFLVLYPVVKYPDKYDNPNLLTLGLMFFFMGINVVLMIV